MIKRGAIQNIVLVFFFAFMGACQHSSDTKRLVLAHGLDVNHSVHKAMEYMADRVSKKSNGRMEIVIYPNQQLGSERELLELLQLGSIDMTKTSAAVLENFAPAIKVLSLPYIFTSDEECWEILNGEIGKRLLIEPSPYYLRGLCYYDAGKRSFYTIDKPVNRPEDLKGLNIRVQSSSTAINLIKSLGGAATPIAWGELYTALQQGVVDGAENNPPSYYLSRHYEVCNYYSLNEHTAVPDVVLISTHTWDRLNEQERSWLQSAADESVIYQRRLWKEAENYALEQVKKAGNTIIYPDKQPFVDATRGMRDEALKDAVTGPYLKSILEFQSHEK